jgi:hypothetical protein
MCRANRGRLDESSPGRNRIRRYQSYRLGRRHSDFVAHHAPFDKLMSSNKLARSGENATNPMSSFETESVFIGLGYARMAEMCVGRDHGLLDEPLHERVHTASVDLCALSTSRNRALVQLAAAARKGSVTGTVCCISVLAFFFDLR